MEVYIDLIYERNHSAITRLLLGLVVGLDLYGGIFDIVHRRVWILVLHLLIVLVERGVRPV